MNLTGEGAKEESTLLMTFSDEEGELLLQEICENLGVNDLWYLDTCLVVT